MLVDAMDMIRERIERPESRAELGAEGVKTALAFAPVDAREIGGDDAGGARGGERGERGVHIQAGERGRQPRRRQGRRDIRRRVDGSRVIAQCLRLVGTYSPPRGWVPPSASRRRRRKARRRRTRTAPDGADGADGGESARSAAADAEMTHSRLGWARRRNGQKDASFPPPSGLWFRD